MKLDAEFRKSHPGYVWTNRNAPDKAWIAAMLMKPRLDHLRELTRIVGIEEIESVWRDLQNCDEKLYPWHLSEPAPHRIDHIRRRVAECIAEIKQSLGMSV